MAETNEQFISSSKTYVQALEELSKQAFASFEKLVDLNLAASKDLLASAFSYAQAVLGAKDAQEFQSLQVGYLEQMAEKSATYGQHFFTVATSGGAEFSKAFESKLSEVKSVFADTLETLLKNAPPGTETVMAAFKNAVSASQDIIEAAQSSAKKAMNEVESNFTSGVNQVNKAAAAAANATKKR
ncbi:MAG: phasin family protein [Pseudomonadota bacterium]